jgi:nucleotide-binding universal stress UspA family protein
MSYPWRRVLIPTDFSTAAEWAFDDAIRVASSTGAELIILHVRMTRTSNPSELRFPADPALYDYAERQELEALRERVERIDSSVSTRLLVTQASDVGRQIARTAAAENVDLIVIATHARHHVAHWIIGSTTLEVVAVPTVPVLSVRYGIRKRLAFRRIVVPTHPDQPFDGASELAAAIAARENGEVHLVCVVDRAQREQGEAFLADFARRKLSGVTTVQRTVTGRDIEREVLRYCDDVAADLVAITHEATLDEEEQIGPLASEIIRRSSIPVLVVPGPSGRGRATKQQAVE